MFTIGDFARLGLISVRMLRHYDAIGLLRPARVDPSSNYRYYEAAQLSRLNRIIALKDLGFNLQQVRAILDEKVGVEELHGMLRLRRAQLEAQITADTARLARVEARLRMIESEGVMSADDILVKQVPAVRVAELTATANSFSPEDIGPAIQPLYGELCRRLDQAGLTPVGAGIAYYENAPGNEGGVVVHAAMPVAAEPRDDYDFAVVDLPAIQSAATLVHHGSMQNVMPTYQALARWIEDNGYRPGDLGREVYLDCPPDADHWVTELQITIEKK